MGRGRKKQQARRRKEAAKKRAKRKARGLNVPFSLSNSQKKLSGRRYNHDLKTNIHNLIYNDGKFENVKYSASNITDCKFKNAKFSGVDFIKTNLKKSNFRNAYFENVIFLGVNLKGTNFQNATFKNTYFIQTDTSTARNLNLESDGITVLNKVPNVSIGSTLEENIHTLLNSSDHLKKSYVLTTKSSKGKKINLWTFHLLLKDFSERDINRGIERLIKNGNTRCFFTYHSYFTFLNRYLKKI